MVLWFFILASVVFGQLQLPFNTSFYVADQPVFVSPCGVMVVNFTAVSAAPNFFWTLTLTPITNTPWTMSVSLKQPVGSTGAIDYKSCPGLQSCSTTSSPCTVVNGCGDQTKQFFAYVETVGPVSGQFSLRLDVYPYPTPRTVTIDDNPSVQNYTTYGGNSLGLQGFTLSDYDYYTFTLAPRPPGTVMDIQINSIGGGTPVNNYLWFTGFVNPFSTCVGPINQQRLVPCQVAAGGTWSLAVQRVQNNQQYQMRLYYTNGININLVEAVPSAGLIGDVNDEIYFRYNVPNVVGSTATTQQQIYFILDSVVGGVVEIKPLFNQNAGTQCAGGLSCASIEGCHVVVPYCQVANGFYTIVAKAIVVLQKYIPVTFNVRAYVKTIDLTPNILTAGTNVRATNFLSEYTGFQFKLPNQGINVGNWMDLEIYVDSNLETIVPAVMFVGSTPFPQNLTYGCVDNSFKRCDARIPMGNQRYCFLQLDPCELEQFPNGVYVTVFTNNQANPANSLQEHTYLQDPMDFTIYTKLRNPNNNLIQHGTVITDEVTEGWKKAYRIDDTVRSGALEIAISANYHYVFPIGNSLVVPNDTARIELDVDIVYAQQPYIGPACITCYRVQSSFRISLRALQTYKFTHRKCVQGFEHVYLVITGNNTLSRINTTSQLFNFSENRFVITAKNFPVLGAQSIRPTEFSNLISNESAFGGIQYWLLNFDRNLLRNSTLALKLRAHPRSGRQMTLFVNDGFDPSCAPANFPSVCGGVAPGLTFTCNVNNTNKGFCFINIQTCFLIPNMNRTFVVEVRSLLGFQNLTVGNVDTEYAYSFTYDLIPSVAQLVTLGKNTQIIVDVESEQYQHFKVQVPTTAPGNAHFIIETYFDSNNFYAQPPMPLVLFVQRPSATQNGAILAGNPVHSAQCLCFTDTQSDVNKIVQIFDRCVVESGMYYFSVYTSAHGFKEGALHVTIKAYLANYVIPIPYESHLDLSLFLGQTAAYQINIDSNLLNDQTRTDKELQIWAHTNLPQYNASVEISFANAISTCGCGGSFTDVNYPCFYGSEEGRLSQNGRCDIITGMCQLTAGNWFILTRILERNPLNKVDPKQLIPFTLTATKLNTITTVQRITLSTTPSCSPSERLPNTVITSLNTEEYVFFDVRGQNTPGFSLYFDNITNGYLEVFANVGVLPTANCTTLTNSTCPETPSGGGPPCVITFPNLCRPTEYIGVKAVSNKKNLQTVFASASCIRSGGVAVPSSNLTFGNLAGVNPTVQSNGAQPIFFQFPQLSAAQSPYVIITLRGQSAPFSYSATLGRPNCAACAGYTRQCTTTGSNCTIYIPFCDLPSDYTTGQWQILLSNTGPVNSFYVAAFAVNNGGGNIDLTTNTLNSFNVPPNSWVNVVWNIDTAHGLAQPSTAIQASSINFAPAGAGLILYSNLNDPGVPCLIPFTNLTINFTSCCTTPAQRIYSFFNQDFQNVASIGITPTIQTYTQNHTKYIWSGNTVTQAVLAPQVDNAGQTRIVEYFSVFPGVPQYGSYVFQANLAAGGVNIYIRAAQAAGPNPPAKGSCLTFDQQPVLSGGVAYFAQMACATSTIPITSSSSDPFFPHLKYTAFENTGGFDITGSFNWSIITPIQVFNNTVSAPVSSWSTANQQFFYRPGPNVAYKNRVFRVVVNVLSGTVNMFVNRKNAAGPVSNCTGQIIAPTGPTSSTATLNIPTCPGSSDTLFVGIVTTTNTATYTVLVTEINTLIDVNNPATILTPSVPTTKNGPTNFDVTFGTVQPFSYMRVNIDNITVGSVYNISIFRDGQATCQNFDSAVFGTFCGATPAVLGWRCTNILPSCQLQAGVTVHLEVAGPSGPTYSITAEIVQFGGGGLPIASIPTPPGNPGELLFSAASGLINPHDLALYKVTLAPRQVLPGENIRVYLDSSDCGTVDAWGFVGGTPGPFCNTLNRYCAAAARCLVTEYKECNSFSASTMSPLAAGASNWATDLYVLIRGKSNTEISQPIRFSFRVERDSSYAMQHFYYLEKHTILPVPCTPPSGIVPVPCPQTSVPNATSCCPVVSGTGGCWVWPPTVFHFPVEGAHFLNDQMFQRLKLSIDNRYAPFVLSADMTVWNQQPSFCNGIDSPNRAENVGQLGRCSVTQGVPNCTVNIFIPFCGLVDSHLLFITVENIKFVGGLLPTSLSAFGQGVSVSHTRWPNTIIPINFNTSSQFISGVLSRTEVHYFKVFHNQVALANYHFHVRVLTVTQGTVSLLHHWSGCPNTAICTVSNCQDVDPRIKNQSTNCKLLPDCACDYEHIPCRGSGDMNAAPVQEGFFMLQGVLVQNGFDVVNYVIQVDFVEPLIALPINSVVACGNETCEEERYYNGLLPAATPDQLYQFRITSLNGQQNVLIAHDARIGLDGYPNTVQAPSCQKTRVCDSLRNGFLDQCVTYYRTVPDLTPYVSVHTTGTCTNNVITRFNLAPTVYVPPYVTLTDGVKQDSQFFQTVQGCPLVNQTYWYKIQLTRGTYYVAELWSLTSEPMQLWVTKDHVSWNAYGEALNIGCQTEFSPVAGNLLYCRYVVACNFTPSNSIYYIQVSDSSPNHTNYYRHQIRVSTMTQIEVSPNPSPSFLPFGQDQTFLLTTDLRQIQTVTITGVSGNEVQPWQALTLYWTSEQFSLVWLTRNKFGDVTCSVDDDINRNGVHKLKVQECQVDNVGGVFVAHFMLASTAICGSARTVGFATRFNSPGVTGLLAGPNTPGQPTAMTIVPGTTQYIKHTTPAIQANQIVYHQLSNFDQQTRLTSTIWRGNSLDTNRATYALPCNPACSQGIREVSSHLSWGDVCWHCGSSLYDTFFAQVDAQPYTGNTSLLNTVSYTSTLSVLTPTALTATPASFTLAGQEAQLQFFTAPYSRTQGSRIELVITSGNSIGLEINVYASDCGLRTDPSQYWCFPGHHCSLPVPENHNFGSHYKRGDLTSPYISPNMLIVVRGFDSSYTISQVQGIASCNLMTAANAPFCFPIGPTLTSRTYWGNTNTFVDKDRNAFEFYNNLTAAFGCPNGAVDHCQCAQLSVPCRTNLAIYACQAIFNPCDANGLEVQPDFAVCTSVELTCNKTFRCAGFPERECSETPYFIPPPPTFAPVANGTNNTRTPTTQAPTEVTNTPTETPTEATPSNLPPSFIVGPTDPPTTQGSSSSSFPAWVPGVVIFLIVLVALLLVAVVVGAVVLISGSAGAGAPNEVDAYQIL